MASLREQIDGYVKRVKELAEHVKGNEQATKQSLIGPFFTMLGYDLTDPRECVPEFKADFGKERSSKPIDWAFLSNGTFSFFVEAKEVGRKLAGFDEQLADYFAKDPAVKLGILTNGAQWRFFTDVEHPNVMDKQPFAQWDVFADEQAPFDVITLLQKASYNAELIRAFAQRQRAQNLLVNELTRLLDPAPEFTKLAIANLETRNLTQAVVESWKPTVAAAIDEWARQRMLTAALTAPSTNQDETPKITTTPEELAAFQTISALLGRDMPVAYEDTQSYFKVHAMGRRNAVVTRLQLGRRHHSVWVPLSLEESTPLVAGRSLGSHREWTVVSLSNPEELGELRDLFRAAYCSLSQPKKSAELA